MRRMALDWTFSRRQIVDLGAQPQTWENGIFQEDGVVIVIIINVA